MPLLTSRHETVPAPGCVACTQAGIEPLARSYAKTVC